MNMYKGSWDLKTIKRKCVISGVGGIGKAY